MYEDELLATLMARGHVSHPSPLLDMLECMPEFMEEEVLKKMHPTDRALRTAQRRLWRTPALRRRPLLKCPTLSGLSSVELLKLAKAEGCPWTARTSAVIAVGGHPEVMDTWSGHGKTAVRGVSPLAPLVTDTWRC